ncbi:hypothetical protein EUTSA_v10027015mg, partial [Eutrema salsugineum]
FLKDIDLLPRTHMEKGARNGFLKETSSKRRAKELALCWIYFPSGWFRFSFNLPGTGVYNMMKAKKKMMKLLKDTVLKKRASGEEFGEFFKIIFGEKEGGEETMSVENAMEVLAATVKLISNHPKVMQELQREHEEIVWSKTGKEAGLTWEDYKSMTFTQMVCYTVPAGWLFFGIPQVHFDEEKYRDPLTFNPWRKDIHGTISRDYMPFGAGATHCVGWTLGPKTRVLRKYSLIFPAGCKVHISKDLTDDH